MAVYHWERGQLLEPLWFAADEDGLTEFSLYLDHSPRDPVFLLVDVVEEEFREETIPHVMGGDRRSLIRTRINRLFRDPTYTYAEVQGREPEGRRDDRVLFTALIRPDLLSPWISQIAKHKVPLAGIYSLPILSEHLIKSIPIESAHALLVTLQSTGGLRQTFFRDKRLRLSRLAIVPHGQGAGRASYVLGEVEKIRRYLNSLRQLPQDDPLDVYIVANHGLLDDITRQSPDSLTTRYHLFELEEIGEKVGIKGDYASDYSDQIFAHLLARKRPANHYASGTQTRHHAMYLTRVGLIAASVLILVGSVFLSGTKFIEGIIAAREGVSLERQIEFYRERLAIERERMPDTPASPRDLKAAVEMADAIRNHKTSPLPMLIILSQGLADFPNLQLDRLDWLSSSDFNASLGEGTRAVSTSRAAQSRNGATPPSDEGNFYQIARVKGRVEPFDGNYRRALDMVSQFAATLRQIPGVEDVQVLDLPLDLRDEKDIAGDTTKVAENAPFVLRVVIREKGNEAG